MRSTVAAALLLATAGSAMTVAQTAKRASPAKPSPSPSANAPEYGRFGFDTAGMDRQVAPGDDFYGYANGAWARATAIPADKSSYGAFDVLADRSRDQTRVILEEERANPASKIGRAYATFLDTATIEAKGLAPVRPWLATIKGASKATYPALLGEAARNGVRGPFGASVGQDAKQPTVYALALFQGGLGLPDRDYYLSTDPKLVEARTAYQAHIAKMLTLAGEPNAAARAAALLAFETEIAKVSWTRTESRDADKTYNRMSVAELARIAPGFDFAAMFRAGRVPVDTLVVAQPSAITGIAKLIEGAPIGVLQDQLLLRSLDGFADVLPKALDDEQFAFFDTTLSGTPQQQERWKRAVDYTVGSLDDEVSKPYVARHFPPATKAAADALVKNVIAAMSERIDKLDWMSPETKVKAHAKLAAFTPKIGYPSRWKDYSGLVVTAGDAFGNKLRSNQFRYDYNVGHLGSPLRRWEWSMTPMTINAYANPRMVEIVFPAAILQPPFFDPKADPAVNYGGIGAVIGHELSHHFDDQGRKYDASGKLTDWWTPADVAAFTKRTDQLVAQYDAYEPLPGFHVKGGLTLGENTADLAGLTVAYDAYKKALGGKAAPMIDGFTGDQRFYLGWEQVWRRNYREANLRQRLLTDPHSPSQQRGWIVRNLDPWYAAYRPAPNGKLVLAPEQRVRIW